MTDTITESFCERCGARYSFDAVAKPRRGGLVRVRVVSRGLKNFVANDGMPMSEAMAAARDEEERAGTARQLDAFHSTFNFCMGCRQYTCPNCWNSKAGECLTCSPDLSREVLPAAFPDLPLDGPASNGNGVHQQEAPEATAWPLADLARSEAGDDAAAPADADVDLADAETLARLDAFASPRAVLGADVAPVTPAAEDLAATAATLAAEAVPAGEPAAAAPVAEDLTADELAEIQGALATEPASPTEAITEAITEAASPLGTAPVEPAADIAPAPEEAAAPALALAAAAAADLSMPEAEETPVQAASLGIPDQVHAGEAPADERREEAPAPPEDAADAGRVQTRHLLGRFRPARGETPPFRAAEPPAGPQPDLAAAATTASAAAAEAPATPPESVPEPAPAPAAAAPLQAPADTIAQPTWQKVAPDGPAVPSPSWPEAPAWPAPPAPGATPPPVAPAAPWASRLAISRPQPTGVWAASSEELLAAQPQAAGAAPAVQACVSCGLSLSANARFCRRCGTRQG